MVEPFENVYELPMDDHNAPNFELSALIRKWNNQLDVFFKARRKRDKVSVLLITMLLICLLVAVALIIMHVIANVEGSGRLKVQIQQLTLNTSNLERQLHLLLGCGYGWHKFMSSCYDFQLRLKKTWYDAKIDCHTKGGYLVKIDNAFENSFLKSYIQTDKNTHNVWIGAHDSERESTFVWESDNSSLSYSDWVPEEPNNHYLNEDCASMRKKHDYRWNDVPCSMLLSYICEIQ